MLHASINFSPSSVYDFHRQLLSFIFRYSYLYNNSIFLPHCYYYIFTMYVCMFYFIFNKRFPLIRISSFNSWIYYLFSWAIYFTCFIILIFYLYILHIYFKYIFITSRSFHFSLLIFHSFFYLPSFLPLVCFSLITHFFSYHLSFSSFLWFKKKSLFYPFFISFLYFFLYFIYFSSFLSSSPGF